MNVIQAGLELDDSRREAVTRELLNLPEPLRPTHYNFGEDQKRKPVPSLLEALSILTDSRQPGPLLYGPRFSYDLRRGRDRTFRLSCFFETADPDVHTLLVSLASAGPLFGYACALSERIARNRVQKQIGVNALEGWVGRNPRKQLPGLYWYTLISDDLIRQLEIPLDLLVAMAKKYEEPAAGQHLFRFYDRPEDWQAADSVNRFIVDQPGIFDIEEVKMQLSRGGTLLEISTLLGRWP